MDNKTKPAKNKDKSDSDEKTVSNAEVVRSIPISKIIPSPFEPQARRRAKFKKEEIESLGVSIIRNGLRQPILVRPFANGERFQIVFGERRFVAAKEAGFEFINCFVEDLSDEQTIELQYEENHNRQEPDPLDDAFTFAYLKNEKGYSIHDLAIKFSTSETSVLRKLKLNDLIDEAKQQLSDGTLPLGHAVYMASFSSDVQKKIVDDEMAYSYEGREGGALTLAEFKQDVETTFVRKLADAPFDTNNPLLHLKGLICAHCTERTGYEPKLFDENLKTEDTCLNKSCFETKTNTQLRIKQDEINEQLNRSTPKSHHDGDEPAAVKAPTVSLVTDRSSYDKSKLPIKGEVLTDQKLQDKPECEFSEIGLAIPGASKHGEVWICKNDRCATHHPEAITPEEKSNDNQPSEQELRRNQFQFDAKVRFALREKAFAEAMGTFTDANIFWQFDDLIQELLKRLWFRVGYDVQNFILTLCKGWKNLPKDKSNKEQIDHFVESLDKEKQSRLLFLFTFYNVGMYSNSDPAELEEFAYRFTKLNYCLIEQEMRHELAPEEFKALAAFNVERVKNGLYMDVENFWWNEPKTAD